MWGRTAKQKIKCVLPVDLRVTSIVYGFTLKNVMKTCEDEKGRRARARAVVTPPLKMAGPRVTSAL